MADIRVNSEGLYQFGKNLLDMANALSNNYSRVKAQTQTVNESWQDSENARFMDEFLNDAEIIFKVSDKMADYGNFIVRKASVLQQYEETR